MMNKLILALIFMIFVSGCSDIELEKPCLLGWKNETHFCNEYHRVESPMKMNETINEPRYIDYENLNYTTLQINRTEFESLTYLRQRDWINGVCYPVQCNIKNPPVCVEIVLVYCGGSHPDYFDNIWINKSKVN
jgi:hypothetical protein